MEREISNFIKAWFLIFASLCYSYNIGKIANKGPLRFAFLVPVISLFLYLPLLHNCLHFIGMTAFFIAFLGTFKLLLFSFGKGPLSSSSSKPVPLSQFLAVSCLPIKISENQNQKATTKVKVSPTRVILFALLIKVYDSSDYLQPIIMLCLIYLILESTLASIAALAQACSGLVLEPLFDEPYLSTSLRDFWGKRWNQAVSSILRQLVYDPPLGFFSAHVVRRKWAPLPAGMAKFIVSAVMHELVLYYLGRRSSNGEMGLFFLLHGVCWCFEIGVKKLSIGETLIFPRFVSEVLTLGFVISTSLWLFMPPFFRIQIGGRMLQEYEIMGGFLKNVAILLSDLKLKIESSKKMVNCLPLIEV